MKILVLGVTGMLGSAVYKLLSESSTLDVHGTARGAVYKKYFSEDLAKNVISGIDVLNTPELQTLVQKIKPNVIINCVGLVKQLAESKDPLVCLPLNSMLPHQLVAIAKTIDARVVHISTDCVFSGDKGLYVESDFSDADDLYGRSKYIGELRDFKNAITLRTSIIGHEVSSNRSLVDWFLAQNQKVKGFRKAIFSGLPTIEMARVIRDYVLPKPELHGLYHVSAKPINKFDLLSLVAKVYKKDIEIVPNDDVQVDRSLNSDRFSIDSGYVAPEWPALIEKMHTSKI